MQRADRFQELFGGLYIGDNPTPHRNGYAVMEFDFSGLDTGSQEDFKKSFSGKVQREFCLTLKRKIWNVTNANN